MKEKCLFQMERNTFFLTILFSFLVYVILCWELYYSIIQLFLQLLQLPLDFDEILQQSIVWEKLINFVLVEVRLLVEGLPTLSFTAHLLKLGNCFVLSFNVLLKQLCTFFIELVQFDMMVWVKHLFIKIYFFFHLIFSILDVLQQTHYLSFYWLVHLFNFFCQ